MRSWPSAGARAATREASPRCVFVSAISTAPTSKPGWLASRARVELGDPKAAVDRLKQYAADLQEKGKDADSLTMLTEAAQIDPEDMSLRQLLVQAYIARGDFDAACQFATSAAELRQLATQLFRPGA